MSHLSEVVRRRHRSPGDWNLNDWMDAARALALEVDRRESALRQIDKLDGRYNDLNTARFVARNALGLNQQAIPASNQEGH